MGLQRVLTIHDSDGLLLIKVRRSQGRLYLLHLDIIEGCNLVQQDTSRLWHKRYGHLNFSYLMQLSSQNIV